MTKRMPRCGLSVRRDHGLVKYHYHIVTLRCPRHEPSINHDLGRSSYRHHDVATGCPRRGDWSVTIVAWSNLITTSWHLDVHIMGEASVTIWVDQLLFTTTW